MRSIQQICAHLGEITDKFEGLAEVTRSNSFDMFEMMKRGMQGTRWEPWGGHGVCAKYVTFPCLLTDAGFYAMGSGCFSIVLGHDDHPETVFKLSLKPEDSYVAYAMYCRQNPGEHLPEIRYMHRAREAQVIAIKKYMPFRDAVTLDFPDASYLFMQYWREAETTRRDKARQIERNPVYTESYIKALVAIGRHFDGAATFDLHSDNLMYDVDTDRFIITDPVSFKKENFHAIERPRKNSDRTDHFAAAQARAIVDAAARGIGARIEQVRDAVPDGNPRLSVLAV